MSTVFENIGFNISREEDVYRLADFVLNAGKILPVQDGAYACFCDASGAEVWERVALDHEAKQVSLLNIDPHFSGANIWRLALVRELTAERDDALDFKGLLQKPGTEQVICARIMGAQALSEPLTAGEHDLQISMIPHSVLFFGSEDEMRSALNDEVTALGALSPVGLYSRMLSDGSEETPTDILLTRVAARIVSGDLRAIQAGDNPVGEFLHICLNTLMGPLDVAVGQDKYTTDTLELAANGGVALITGVLSAKAVVKRQDAND